MGPGESEWLTRKSRIDSKLRALNLKWEIVPHHHGLNTATLTRHAVTEFPTANGPADYALFVNGKLLGIIEAKKVTVNPQNVLEQAKRYTSGVTEGVGALNGYKVPFLYATNGEIIWFIDMREEKPVSRTISNFHTCKALDQLFAADAKPAHAWLLDTPIERIEHLRDYQRDATSDRQQNSLVHPAPFHGHLRRAFETDIRQRHARLRQTCYSR